MDTPQKVINIILYDYLKPEFIENILMKQCYFQLNLTIGISNIINQKFERIIFYLN